MEATTESPVVRLSVCISTFNRAKFIGATLESIIGQLSSDCEIVVSDNASTDETETIVSEYARRCDRLRYVRHVTNEGLDQNYDRAVELSRGEYCWLMADDDLFKPGAVDVVLNTLPRDFSLILVNYERRTQDMSTVLLPRAAEVAGDRVYAPSELDRLFLETSHVFILIGSVVIKREIWLARERRKYYGSFLIHIAVIFQASLPHGALLVAQPLVSYRDGNFSASSPDAFEVLLIKYPLLIKSLALSEALKKKYDKEPWKRLRTLLFYRAMGWYSVTEYYRWIHPIRRTLRAPGMFYFIACLPGALMNALYLLYYHVALHDRFRKNMRNFLEKSHFHRNRAMIGSKK